MRRFSGRENLSTKWWTSDGNVVRSLAQRRYVHGKHIQPVVQIAAEQAVGDHLLEIAIGGRDQPHVNPLRPGAPQPLELLLLQRAQQLRLNLRRNVPGFVEKQRAAVGELQAADLAAGRAGKRAPLVSEELAFDQRCRKRRQVQAHERPIAARAEVVDGAREHLFARAGLATNQDRGIGRRHGFDGPQHALERRALADDAAEIVVQPNLGLEVLLLLGEMVLQAHDFLIRQRVFHRNRDLRRDLLQQVELLYGKCVRIDARDIERAKRAAPRHQRDAAQRLERRRQQRRTILEEPIEILLAEHARDTAFET